MEVSHVRPWCKKHERVLMFCGRDTFIYRTDSAGPELVQLNSDDDGTSYDSLWYLLDTSELFCPGPFLNEDDPDETCADHWVFQAIEVEP